MRRLNDVKMASFLYGLITFYTDVMETLYNVLIDGALSIGVQNVTSNCNVATLNSFFFSLYLARRLASGETFIRW